MYLAAVIFAGILAFTLLANLKGKENWKTADKKEHPLKLFYPFAESLYSLLKRKIGPDIFGSRAIFMRRKKNFSEAGYNVFYYIATTISVIYLTANIKK